MAHAIIDRKSGKVLEVSSTKKGLHNIKTVHLEEADKVLQPNELRALYRQVTGKMRSRLQPKQMVKQICEALSETEVHAEVTGNVAKARIIFESMEGEARKDILDECVRQGVNINTAKTQYYLWKHAHASAKLSKPTLQ